MNGFYVKIDEIYPENHKTLIKSRLIFNPDKSAILQSSSDMNDSDLSKN